jgi:hypothetical protein
MSASERVLKRIRSNKRGRILFPTDFSDITDGITLRQIFARLTIDKTLIRLARGIYLFPVIDEKLGPLIPPLEDIAAAVARRDKARIIPTGVYALNRLGLSTQVPMKIVFLTDGAPRSVKVGKRSFTFQKTSTKILAIKDELLCLIITAFQELGKDSITKEIIDNIKPLILKNASPKLHKDLHLAPAWVRNIIKQILTGIL